MNTHHNSFKKYSWRSQFFFICLALVCIFVMVYIYNNFQTPQEQVIILSQEDDDTVEIVKLNGETEQKEKLTLLINGFLMEPVRANYTRNIYFTIKTAHKFHTDRLLPLMLTWLQLVDKNKLSIITDKSASKQNYFDMFRRVGYNIEINNECKDDTHSRKGLCCKMGTEFATYYKAVQEHPSEEDGYQWYCHVDDDMYVNIPQLSHLLQQYDPHKPYYIGKWPGFYWGKHITINDETVNHFSHDMHLHLKQRTYRYGTGSIFCISYPLMMEAKKFFSGPKSFAKFSVSAKPHIHDDMVVGFVLGALLGHNLTDTVDMTNQYDDYVKNSTLKDLIRYITISRDKILTVHSLDQVSSSLKDLPSLDPPM